MKKTEDKYGKIELLNNKIVWTKANSFEYEIPVDEIKVIGEFTTNDGPFYDDWFIVIITNDSWYELPMDIQNIMKMLEDLGNEIGANLEIGLANSIDWKTRILYPVHFKGKELFEKINVAPVTFGEKLKKQIGFEKSVRQYSDTVKSILGLGSS